MINDYENGGLKVLEAPSIKHLSYPG